jgi:hypothetical protein
LVGATMLSGFLGAAVRAQGGAPFITEDADGPLTAGYSHRLVGA